MQILSYAPGGYHGDVVSVEVDCRTGIPGLEIVGLPASEVREARERARVAIRNSGFEFPTRRILISLSPADVQKSGNGFDLAIAAAVLAGSAQLRPPSDARVLMLGELHLDGRVGPVRGVLAAVAEAADSGVPFALVPEANLAEARSVGSVRAAGIGSLSQIGARLSRLFGPEGDAEGDADGGVTSAIDASCRAPSTSMRGGLSDYGELRGLAELKRILEIAAAGGHHVLIVGPPGAGKSAAVGLLPTILTRLGSAEAIEVSRVHSLAGELRAGDGLLTLRPFRAPHHNSSTEGLLGGGRPVMPGEVALAHRGVLFLDEALEFRRPVLQGLREPLERARVGVTRAGRRYWYPAEFQLVLATNPCPCGMLGRAGRSCLCSVADVDRYWRRLGGPLLDRIDLRIACPALPLDRLPPTDGSRAMAARVGRAVERQRARAGGRNQSMTAAHAYRVCDLNVGQRALLARASRAFTLSTRASLSILRVARTIADLADSDAVRDEHLLEAVAYRRCGEDRPLWQE